MNPPPCSCCANIIGRPPTPARYRWIGQNGHVSYVCESCCAIWRANGEADPDLAPARITEL